MGFLGSYYGTRDALSSSAIEANPELTQGANEDVVNSRALRADNGEPLDDAPLATPLPQSWCLTPFLNVTATTAEAYNFYPSLSWCASCTSN